MANPGDFAYTVKQQAHTVRIVGDYIKLKKTEPKTTQAPAPSMEKNRILALYTPTSSSTTASDGSFRSFPTSTLQTSGEP